MIISFKKSAKENLFQPVDALPLGIFRFLFGFLLCIEFLVLSRETFPHYYIEPVFHFTYPLFDLLGLKPLSKPSSMVDFQRSSKSPQLVLCWGYLREYPLSFSLRHSDISFSWKALLTPITTISFFCSHF